MEKFIPILLGSDSNVYGMARSFYEEYGISSIAYGKGCLAETRYSKFVKVYTVSDFDNDKKFCETLLNAAKELEKKYETLLLISCGDGYTELIVKNKNKLKKKFVIPYIEEELRKQLEFKTSFYNICEKYNLDIPKTVICNIKNKDKLKLSFPFPVALKPADSISYAECDFPKKKKCYKINDVSELHNTIDTIFNNGYNSDLIIQEFIPGDASSMFVLNAYSDRNANVKMMCLGQCVIEDCTPKNIGNYDALISCGNQEIYNKTKNFLEEIKYIGFSNFDFKYDIRDQKYKLFEINIRQGRSSYFTTAAGCNMAKFLVEDYVYHKDENECVYNDNAWLWLNVPLTTIKKYVKNNEILNHVKALVKEKKYCYTLISKKDLNFKRIINVMRIYLNKKRGHDKYNEVNNK